MHLNTAGEIVQTTWNNLPVRYPNIELDAFIIMPNHIHGIINIVGAGLALPVVGMRQQKGAASSAPTIGDVIRVLKSISAININRLLNRLNRPVWQRNYYEHVIRNENELLNIRQYIDNNPLKWEDDENFC
jgi:putative transposase